jgi:tetratricopeptide (TPR) repeat protein
MMGLTTVLWCLVGAAAAEPLSIDSVQKYMQWGEYDKIIAAIEPVVKEKKLPNDTTAASDLLKYLGVAYFANGKIAEARAAFSDAFHTKPSVALEELYVSKEILVFFNVVIAEEKSQIAARDRADSLARIREIDRVSSQYRTRFSLGVASFVVAGIGAVIAVYEYHIGDSLYWEWNAARRLPRGDKAAYDALKPKIRTADILTETAAAAAAVAVISGTYFTVRAWHSRQAKQKLLIKRVSFAVFPKPFLSLLVDF